MNVTELARKLRTTTNELFEQLPKMGFDVGRRAIKIDDRIAERIIRAWSFHKERLAAKKKAEEEMKKIEEIRQRGPIKILPVMTVRDFALKLDLPVTKILSELMKNGIVTSLNERLDFETATILAEDLGIEVVLDETENIATTEDKAGQTLVEILSKQLPEDLKDRPPVVVIMGHVDHGKTKLLDAIRDTHVVEGESGGITQHIGAYQAWAHPKGKGNEKKIITFIDTPGHEAFTTMRSRGAKIADIAVLVVAADDGVMPQTVEAYKIIEKAKLPVIVAINKIDKPGANIEKVKQELSAKLNLLTEEWGGKTICVEISAKNKTNLDQLLEMILLITEMEQEKIKANPSGEAAGTVIEAHIDRGEGPVATVLVQNGALNVGDYIMVNNTVYGKIRAMRDFHGSLIKQALPSMPVKILGLKIAPQVGDVIQASAEAKIESRDLRRKKFYNSSVVSSGTVVTNLDSGKDSDVNQINIILKADVLGSLEVLLESIQKIEHHDVKVNIVSKDLGSINESDVLRAEAVGGFIIGFYVLPTTQAQELAKTKNVEIKHYKIIYELLADLKKRIEDKIAPEIIRHDLGKFQVKVIFRQEKNDYIVGGKVLSGLINKNAKLTVFRADQLLGPAKLLMLKSGKEEVNEVASGQECGLKINFPEAIQIDDVLEFYREESKAIKL